MKSKLRTMRMVAWTATLWIWPPTTPTSDPEWPMPTRRFDSLVEKSAVTVTATPSVNELIRTAAICITWNQSWAGDLGSTLLYRVRRVSSDTLRVGYFAYWTTERPWGDNLATRLLLPALVIDAVYSHTLFIFPGFQRLLYGPGDVEGVRVTYRITDQRRLIPISIVADNEMHDEVDMEPRDMLDPEGRLLLFDDAWSHQLGGLAANKRFKRSSHQHCFDHKSILPLSEQVAEGFRLGTVANPRRAGPAWRL